MIDTGLLICPHTGQNWTLNSFRHTYASDTEGHQHPYDCGSLQPSHTTLTPIDANRKVVWAVAGSIWTDHWRDQRGL